ncbi:MAG: flavin reductase family protein [Synergistaceae bacterium]|jgi:flavin reductase (DIM6/NTAB) family NADH-FMN oxidoreductase RutF|nr:flavin reductase family protein [Synergistaceae bacterium]
MSETVNDVSKGAIDPAALFTFSYGLYIVGTAWEGRLNAQVADAVMQLTAQPVCVAVSINKANYTTELLEKSKKFSVCVFGSDVPMPFIGNFGFHTGRDYDKFAKCSYRVSDMGLPIVTEYSLAAVEAEVIEIVDIYTHKLFIGEARTARILAQGIPLTYADYHNLKKGKSPAGAPSSVFNELPK